MTRWWYYTNVNYDILRACNHVNSNAYDYIPYRGDDHAIDENLTIQNSLVTRPTEQHFADDIFKYILFMIFNQN